VVESGSGRIWSTLMTLQAYLKIFSQRWLVIVACAVAAGAVTWIVSPATAPTTKPGVSYTATATLIVESAGSPDASVPMGRIPLYLTTGEIPKRAAANLGYTGDPALLAAGLTVTPDFQAQALTVSATDPDGATAAAVANAFAQETVAFFEEGEKADTGNVGVTILQEATPIPDETSEQGGFVLPPGRAQRAVLAANLGLLLGLALALVLDRVDSRLRTRDEINDAVRLPIIAEIPKLTRPQRALGPITVAEDPLSPYADGYRAARTALVHTQSRRVPDEFAPSSRSDERRAGTRAKVILVTSGLESEGKTTSAANLAASFAETGQRVLVLDADLRSPDTHNLFDVPQGAGISDFVTEPADSSLEALVRPTSIPGVRIITAGTRLTHPASLASRLGHLLTEVREMADVVIVDSAPLLAASDVFDILPMVDTVVIVARSGRLTETQGNRVSELLARFQVQVGGVILVGVSASGAPGYGYGYGYGYGETKKGKKAQRAARRAPEVAAPEGGTVTDRDGDDELVPGEPDSRRSRRTSTA